MKVFWLIFTVGFCTTSILQAQQNTVLPKKRYQMWIFPNIREPVRQGLLYEIKDSSILFSNSLERKDYSIGKFGLAEMGVNKIKMVKVRKVKAAQTGMLIGGLTGATAGLILGIVQYQQEGDDLAEGFQTIGLVVIPVAFTGVCLALGLAATGYKIAIPIKGSLAKFEGQRARLEKYSYQSIADGKVPASRMFLRSPYTVTDIDGNSYDEVMVGGKLWMAENLKVTHYRNGDPIPQITGKEEWSTLTTGAYCNPVNDSIKGTFFGRLYNRFALTDSRNLCPAGWHMASYNEWETLIDTLGGAVNAGALMIDKEIPRWSRVNRGKASYSPFAVMSGSRDRNGEFTSPGGSCRFWWSKEKDPEVIFGLLLEEKSTDVVFISRDAGENAGMSVRCVRDQ